MQACPFGPEWNTLVNSVGEFQAYRDYLEQNGDIRTPEQVKAKLVDKGILTSIYPAHQYQIERTENSIPEATVEVFTSMAESLLAKFPEGYAYKLVNLPNASWKGMIEPATGANAVEGRPTVLINTAKASLDTPIHEFGHIFLNMLKEENLRLYFKLIKGIFKNKTEKETYIDDDGNEATRNNIVGYEVRDILEGVKLKEEFEIIKQLYPREADEKEEDAELRQAEELIVEMLGRFGAKFFDKDTGTFKENYKSDDVLLNSLAKYLHKIWEAIKEILFRGNVTINMKDISPDTPIETLAAMLAAPNVKFETKSAVPSVPKSQIDFLKKRLTVAKSLREELNTLTSLFDNKIGDTSYYISPSQKEKLDLFKQKLPDIRKYVDRETNLIGSATLRSGLKALSQELRDLRSSENSQGREITFEKMQEIFDQVKYARVKFLLKGVEKSTEYILKKISINSYSTDRYLDDIQDTICTIFWGSHQGSDPSAWHVRTESDNIKNLLTAATPPLNEIFNFPRALYTEYNSRFGTYQVNNPSVIASAKASLDDKIESMNQTLMNPGSRFNTERKATFEIKGKRPNTGEVVVDNVTVTGRLDSRTGNIYVEFRSDVWGMTDPYWITPATPSNVKKGMKVKMGHNLHRGDAGSERNDSRPDYGVIETDGVSATVIQNPTNYYKEYIDAIKNNDQETLRQLRNKVHTYLLSDLDAVVNQKERVFQVMNQVMDELASNFADVKYNSFSFSVASGESLTRESGAMRKDLYNISARRVFGRYSVQKAGDDYTIYVPSSFRNNMSLQQPVYQRDSAPDTINAFAKEHEDELSAVGIEPMRGALKVDPVSTDNASGIGAVKSFARSLANQLKVGNKDMQFAFIDAAEAAKVTADSKNPWNGEKAFFIGDTIYFVGDNISLNDVFHEFSHPFVRTLAIQNTELFNKLYDEAISTQEGLVVYQQVKAAYPHLGENSPLFKEEIVVRALTAAADMENVGVEQTKGFAKVIQKIFDAVKKLLRSMFGTTISVSKLDPNTTIREVANMLKEGKSFILDESVLNEVDTVSYVKDLNGYMEDLKKVSKPDLLEMIMKGHDIALKHIDTIMRNKNYKEIAAIMTDEFNRGDLQEIRRNLSKYARPLQDEARKKRNAIEYERAQLEAMVNSLFRLQTMVGKISKHMEELSQQPDNIDNMHKAYYYDYLLKYWEGFIGQVTEALDAADIKADTDLSNLVTGINRSIGQSKKYTKQMFARGAQDILHAELRPMGEKIAERYSNIIESLKKRNAPQAVIDKWMVEYYGLTGQELNRKNELDASLKNGTITTSGKKELDHLTMKSMDGAQITDAKIKLALEGKLDDANVFSSFFEGYLYNSDPIVGGFALYVKNQMSDVMNIAQGKFNEYAEDMKDLLEAAGYNPANVNELMEKVASVQYVGKRNEKGEWIEKPIWTLKSMHKDWRIHLDRHRKDIDEAEKNHSQNGTKEDHEKLVNAVSAKKKLLSDYFYQEYQQEVYSRDKLLQQDAIGMEAAYRKDAIFDEMSRLSNPLLTQMDELETSAQMDLLWRQYHQLFSIVDLNANLKTGMDLDVTKRLKEHRSASVDPKTGESYYDWKPRTGVFENNLAQYEQELVNKGLDKDPEAYEKAMKEWLDANMRIVVKPEFYQQRKVIMDAIDSIMSKLSDADRKKVSVTELWSKILDLTAGNRDDDGQPDGTNFTQDGIAFIKTQQELINKAMEEFSGLSGLTKAEGVMYQGFWDVINAKERRLTEEEQQRFDILMNKSNRLGLSKVDKTRLFGYFAKLQGLQKKIATDYYVDVMNNWLSKLDTTGMTSMMGSNSITKESANFVIEDRIINALLSQNTPEGQEFATWFKANHIRKTVYDKEVGGQKEIWERIYAWNVVRPVEDDFYEITKVKKRDGTEEDVRGLPSMKYYARVIKPQYRTERIVGVTVDNQGNYLPRMDVPDSPFIDHDYMNMQHSDPQHYAILEKMKEHHLRNQEGLGYKSRLYLDIPRYRKNNLEVLRTKQLKELAKSAAQGSIPILQLMIERLKNFIRKAKDEPGSQYNWNDDAVLVRADMFDNEITNIPISGLYDLDIDDVSPDVNQSLMRYMFSAERQKKLIEINPVAQALKATVNDPDNMAKQLDRINKFNFIHRGVVTYLNKKGKYTRQVAVNNLIEREFEGKVEAGFTKDMPWLQNTANMIFKKAAFSFFALNIPSAIKNAIGAKFQAMIESAGGEHIDFQSMTKAEGWAFNTMAQVSSTLYYRGAKPLNMQLVYSFDAIREVAEKKMPESMSRTFAHDLASISWLTNFRKWTEDQATVQLFGGMMYKQKLKKADGTEISYMDAWENPDNQLKLKDGIDVRWANLPTKHIVSEGDSVASLAKMYHMSEDDMAFEVKNAELKPGREVTINNGKYKDFRNRFHTVQMSLNGAYDKFDQPEAQRYLAFRFISFLKRYFTTMLINRWGFSGSITGAKRGRVNPGLGDVHEGYYVSTLKTMYRVATMGMEYLPYMQKQEKKAMLKTLVEVLSVMSLLMILAPLLGWDPKDPDRFEKLRKRSGNMPFFGLVPEDPEHPFQMGGWLMNHALKMTLDVRSENEAFLPFPGYGLDNYYSTMTDVTSIGFGPTLKTYKQMIELMYQEATGNPYARYQKDAGPYDWQKEGGSKLATTFLKSIGFSGSTVDPVIAIKNMGGPQRK
jgi:hypothetical protein